jgi:basic membrane protein A
MKVRQLVGIGLVLAVLATGCGDDPDSASTSDGDESERPGVAMILPGPISDSDYNAVGYEALESTGESLDLETAYSDAVQVADAERVARDYATSGYEIIILHGAQFSTVATTLAPQFPDTQFVIQSSGPQESLPENVYNLARTYIPGFFLLGRLAAHASETGSIGFLGGLSIPDFKGGANAVYAGAQSVNPEIRMQVTFTGDQNDPVKGGQAAQALLTSGSDVLVIALNNGLSGAVEALLNSDRRILFTSLHTDKTELAPENFLASMEFNYADAYPAVIETLLDGSSDERYSLMEPQNDGVLFSEVYNVADDVQQQFDDDVVAASDGSLEFPEVDLEEVNVPSV